MAEDQTIIQNTSDNLIIESDAVPISLVFNDQETTKIEQSGRGAVETEPVNFRPSSTPFQRGRGAPPFLTKTYDMVDDPSIDGIVSWNTEADGFIVWDSKEFCSAILPCYFKHNNFSSFIRQLNIYGFKKVDHDRWEFAHIDFQKGKRSSLENIKRTRRDITHKESNAFSKRAKLAIDTQLELLKKEHSMLLVEIMKIRQKQETYTNNVAAFEDSMRCALECHQKLVRFFARTMGSPKFVEKMLHNKRKRKELNEGINEWSLGINFIDQNHSGQYKLKNGVYEQGSSSNVSCETTDPNWEQMIEELLGDNEAGVMFDGSNSKILRELENLIHKPKEWIMKFLESEF